MRPAPLLIGLVLGLAALTIVLMVATRDNATLLALIWGGLLAAAAMDLLSSISSRNLALEADLSESGFTGMSVPLTATLSTRKGNLPAALEVRLSLDHGLKTARTTTLTPGPGTTKIRFNIPLELRKRGTMQVKYLAARYASRFGLFEILPKWQLNRVIASLPNIHPVLNGDIQARMLPLMDGMKTTNMRGEGAEFHQLRDFVAGMDPRTLDWKRSARMNTLVARETRAERNHQIMICVDSGHLMAERIGKLAKLDHAINAALALTWAGALGGDNIGFYSFDSTPGQMIAPRSGRTAFARIRAACADLRESPAETNHTLAMTHLHSKLSRRSLVVIFSDFVDSVTAELLIENMAVITRQHLVLYVALRDRAIEDISRPETLSMQSIAQAISAAQIKQERASVLDRLRRLGVHCIDTNPENLTADLVSRYIDIKMQGLI